MLLRALTLPFLCCLALVTTSTAFGRELLVDVAFEGDGTAWPSGASEGDGDWYQSRVGSLTPLSRQETSVEGGGEGQYAVSDQFGGTTSAMWQKFAVPKDPGEVRLSFDMFVNDWSNQTQFNSGQHARVDLIPGDASPLDVEGGEIANFYLGTDGGPLPNPFLHYQFNLTPLVSGGGEYQLRFAMVNSLDSLNVGVDNVSIQVVPEPSLGVLLIGSLLGALLSSRQFIRRTGAC